MGKLIVAALLLALAISTVVPRVGPIDSHAPLAYKVNLADPPKVRWAPIIRDYKEALARFL